jgi:hypothetical protein
MFYCKLIIQAKLFLIDAFRVLQGGIKPIEFQQAFAKLHLRKR